MYELPWLVTIGIAASSTYAWAVLDRRVVLTTAVSAGTWVLLAFGSATIRSHTETGATYSYSAEYVQYVFAFLAAVSMLAWVASVWWDNLPTAKRDPNSAEADPQ